MAGFVAADAVEEMSYDFKPYADVSGTVAEPSGDAITAYRKAIVMAYQSSGIAEYAGVKETSDIDLSKIDEVFAASDTVSRVAIDATALITGVSADVVSKLPYRIQQAFLGYVMGVFLNPEA